MDYAKTVKKQWFRDYDGYKSEPIWHRDANESSFFNQATDSQCVLPLPSIEELEKQLEALENH